MVEEEAELHALRVVEPVEQAVEVRRRLGICGGSKWV